MPHVVELKVMAEPVNADHDEAQDVRSEVGQHGEQGGLQVGAGADGWNIRRLKIEGQKSHGNGEHTIGERLDPPLGHRVHN